MQLLKSFFKAHEQDDIYFDHNDLKDFLDIGGLSYIKEIKANEQSIVSKIKELFDTESELYNLKSAKIAFIHISTRPDLPFEIAQSTIEAINECLGDKIDDVYIGTNTSQEQTSDTITCGIMLGGIKQRK
ncbi:hypothetical protein [Campylobacter devanensis]|uniref:hypothetical protein n=1 Tax=Campylobacter devanensis TaxID=3161138 RepID=UPI000A3386D2|nr:MULTISPECIES: hypothetical protein [unclassified Campylobacter]